MLKMLKNKKNVLFSFFFLLSCVSCKSVDNLNIEILDIGKADCSIVSYQNSYSLIDTGEEDDGNKIVNFLVNKKVQSIDKLIITHFDKDHIGGADKIIDRFDVKQIYVPDYVDRNLDYIEFETAYMSKNYVPTVIKKNTTINISSLEAIIYPSSDNTLSDNNMSLVTRFTYQNTSFLFTGDILNKRMIELGKYPLKSNFLKVPYHGIYQSSLENFINQVEPNYAVITCSNKNLEDQETVDLLNAISCETYLTRKGNVFVQSDGKKISVNYK